MSPVCRSYPSLTVKMWAGRNKAIHTYFLVPGGYRPGSGLQAQKSLDILEKKQSEKEYRFSLI